MTTDTQTLGAATVTKNRISAVAQAVAKKDNEEGVDLNPEKGEVAVSLDAMKASGKAPIIIPKGAGFAAYNDRVQDGRVSLDPANGAVQNAAVNCVEYFNTSYGEGGGDVYHYKIEEKQQKDGFLGLFGKDRQVRIYSEKCDDWYSTRNHLTTITEDKNSGEILGLDTKRWAATYPQAAVRALPLALIAGALCAIPFSLPAAILGPLGGFAFGFAAAELPAAYFIHKAWD